MARSDLTRRLEQLEHSMAPKFTGYACIDIHKGMTRDQAVAAWEVENGPVGGRRIILWNFGRFDQDTWAKMVFA